MASVVIDHAIPIVLTDLGSEFPLTEQERGYLCFLSDGKLLVMQGQLKHPYVESFIARLRDGKRRYMVQEVTAEQLAAAYGNTMARRSRSGVITEEQLSTMQGEALRLIRNAVAEGASDIHLRVSEKSTEIYYRIDGDLSPNPVQQASREWGITLSQTIFHSMTDVSGTNYTPASPQDALIRTKVNLPNEISSIRVGTLPKNDGNVLVMRQFFREFSEATDLDSLGYFEKQKEIFHRIASRPHGILLISGPTGSGKTTTLQVGLKQLITRAAGTKNIVMIEDPTELDVPGAIQSSVTSVGDEDRNTAFRAFIRAALRVDPDVMMISEMRDLPSSELTVQAAMTGHFVFSTTHANSAFETLPRLAGMGVKVNNLYDHNVLAGIAAQRLVRKVCPHCSLEANAALEKYGVARIERLFDTTSHIFSETDRLQIRFRGPGCRECRGRGSAGRLAVAEIVEMDATIAYLLSQDKLHTAERIWRERGNFSMLQSAIIRVKQGVVCPFDAEAVVGCLDSGLGTINWDEINVAPVLEEQT